MTRLYHFALSPFCRKVRLVLAEKKIDVELVDEKYWEPSTEFLQRNPAGKVPILKIDGLTLTESGAICEYIEETHPDPPLMPTRSARPRRGAAPRVVVRRQVPPRGHEEPRLRTREQEGHARGLPDGKAVKAGATAIKYHLRYMEWLLDHRRWLAGDRMTMADFAAAAHISCLDYISDVDWTSSQPVKDWYATLKSRPAFRSILSDHVPGFAQPPHYANLDF
jgi:glutathione S-transferase